jgi:hypothetical protein
LVLILSVAACGCGSSEPRTEAEIESARESNAAMRQIDKARDVAQEAGKRSDDEALH